MTLGWIDPETLVGNTSISDKAIVGYLNETREAVNALAAQLTYTAPPSVTITIGAELEAAIAAVPAGATFLLKGPTQDITCHVEADA